MSAHAAILYKEFENNILKITSRDQWIKHKAGFQWAFQNTRNLI